MAHRGVRIRTSALVVLVAVALAVGLAPSAFAVTVSDDFSTDSGLWTYTGSAVYDPAGYARMTVAVDNQIGQAWYTDDLTKPFTAEFDYFTGLGTPQGGDGLVFMFYKDAAYTPGHGGWLAFNPPSVAATAAGYGIELDSFFNASGAFNWDSVDGFTGRHIALIEDSVTNHLQGANSTLLSDDLWHHVVVTVGQSSIQAAVDGTTVINWTGTIDRTYAGIGFGGGTGISTDDVQRIDNFVLTYDATAPVITINGVTSGGSYTDPVTITFSATDDVDGPVPATATLNGAPFTSGTEVSAAGSYTLAVTATDSSGNTSIASLDFSIEEPAPVSTSASSPWSVALGLLAAGAVIVGIARSSRKA